MKISNHIVSIIQNQKKKLENFLNQNLKNNLKEKIKGKKETSERLIIENNRKIRILTEQAMNFVLTDYYFSILLEIKNLQKENDRLEKQLKQYGIAGCKGAD